MNLSRGLHYLSRAALLLWLVGFDKAWWLVSLAPARLLPQPLNFTFQVGVFLAQLVILQTDTAAPFLHGGFRPVAQASESCFVFPHPQVYDSLPLECWTE